MDATPEMMSALSTSSVLVRSCEDNDHIFSSGTPPLMMDGWRKDYDGPSTSKKINESDSDNLLPREECSTNKKALKETTTLQGNIDRLPSVDWDRINYETEQRVLEMGKNNLQDSNDRRMLIGFLDAVRALKSDADAWEPYLLPSRFHGESSTSCLTSVLRWFRCVYFNCTFLWESGGGGSGSADNLECKLQWDAKFSSALPSVPFDHGHNIHRRLLVTIHSSLLHRVNSNSVSSSRISLMEWENLGFQGSDPATDLRSTGIFGLLQLVYLAEYYSEFTSYLWETCTRGGSGKNVLEELPFVLIGFNFSAVVLDALMEHTFYMDMRCSAQSMVEVVGKSPYISNLSGDELLLRQEFPFLAVCCEYYVGCLFHFWKWWLQLRKQRGGQPPTIGDFGVVKAKLCAKIKRSGPQYAFDACNLARDPAILMMLGSESVKDTGVDIRRETMKFSSV